MSNQQVVRVVSRRSTLRDRNHDSKCCVPCVAEFLVRMIVIIGSLCVAIFADIRCFIGPGIRAGYPGGL